MESRTHHSNDNDKPSQGGDPQHLIQNARRLARLTPEQRSQWGELITSIRRAENPYDPPGDPAIPPQAFLDALRKPKAARRRPASVHVDGYTISVLLNPTGKADPEREVWLWNFLRNLVRELTQEAIA